VTFEVFSKFCLKKYIFTFKNYLILMKSKKKTMEKVNAKDSNSIVMFLLGTL